MVRPELDDTQQAPPTPDRTVTAAGEPHPAASAQLPAGKQLGHFRIERLLGAGGMGEVYLATDLALDRPVAIKVLPEQVARDPRRRERMVREARAQARITHPNVCHMYFIGEDGDRLYFAMEYVAGKTLAERIEGGPLSVDNALAVIRAAALGLREAQRNGFTHRDVKPSNLMIDSHGVLKLLDFGLASGFEVKPGEEPVVRSIPQTSLAGTPLYMAPEQARGEPVDFRADIYALGATLYHLISGKPPFRADSVDELASLHATAARPPLPRRGQPRTQIGAIDALCSKMMAARPEDRFASYDELLRALELTSMAHTRPAGFWARGVAMFIDLMVVTIALGIVKAIFAITGLEGGLNVTMPYVAPLLALYDTIAVARWGRTIGKALIELEVVDVETAERPSLGRSARRALAMFGLVIVASWARIAFAAAGYEVVAVVLSVLTTLPMIAGPVLLLYASARISGKRAVWDRVAGTLVRYRTTRAASL